MGIQIEKVDWALMQMTLKLKQYNSMSDLNLSNIALHPPPLVGFELAIFGLRVHCLNHSATLKLC